MFDSSVLRRNFFAGQSDLSFYKNWNVICDISVILIWLISKGLLLNKLGQGFVTIKGLLPNKLGQSSHACCIKKMHKRAVMEVTDPKKSSK